MALVGNISGSINHDSWIGVSGTLIFANEPDARFPSVSSLGADVSFFVSGSLDSKGGPEKHVSLFGGDMHVSGTITVGSGSVKMTSNDIQWGSFGNRIELTTTDELKFYDSVVTAGKTLTELGQTSAAGSVNQIQFNGGSSTLDASLQLTFVEHNSGTPEPGEFLITDEASAMMFKVTPANGDVYAKGEITTDGNLNVNGSKITSTTTSFQLLNENVTSLAAAAAATQLNLGYAGGDASTTSIANSLVNGTSINKTINIGGGGGSTPSAGTLIYIGDTSTGTPDNASPVSISLGTGKASSSLTLGSTSDVSSNLSVNIAANSGGGPATVNIAGGTGTSEINVGQTSGTSTITFGLPTTNHTVVFNSKVNSDLLPETDNSHNLGSELLRWANVYTGDLHLRNDRGDYTLIEEEDMLTIRFNKTGKRYKFLLEAVPQLDEEPKLNF